MYTLFTDEYTQELNIERSHREHTVRNSQTQDLNAHMQHYVLALPGENLQNLNLYGTNDRKTTTFKTMMSAQITVDRHSQSTNVNL